MRAALPSPDTVNSKVNPPYAGDAEDGPERGLLAQRANGEPCEDEKVKQRDGNEDGQAHDEEEDVEWYGDSG